MCLTGCNSPSGGSASSSPQPSGTPSTGSAGSATTTCCAPFVIKPQTVATQPANRARTKIGIAEDVNLTTDPVTSVTWTIVGDDGQKGSLSTASGNATVYTACDRGKTVTVNAACTCGTSNTIALNVVQPTSGTLEVPIDVSAISPPTIIVGFTAFPTAQDAEVSFLNCDMREGTCPAVCSGVFLSQNGNQHADTGQWVPFSANVDAHGTQLTVRDTIKTGMPISTFPTGGNVDGNFHWAIPWRAQVRGGGTNGEYVYATADHVKAYTASTRVLDVSKGGQSAHRTVP